MLEHSMPVIFESHEVPLAPPEVRPAIYVEGPRPKNYRAATSKQHRSHRHSNKAKSKKSGGGKKHRSLKPKRKGGESSSGEKKAPPKKKAASEEKR